MGLAKEKSIETDNAVSILTEFVKQVLRWGKTVQMPATDNSLFPRGKEIDISSEVYRLYRFPKGESVMIKKPMTLIVSDNGHRVVDQGGYSHYIPYGWIHLKFKVEKDKPHFYCQNVENKVAKLKEKKKSETKEKKE